MGFWLGLLLFLGMLLAEPPSGLTVSGWRTAALAVLMAIWWMTEAIPIAATSLLPLLLLPLMGVRPVDAAAAPYANPIIFLFLGGFLLALAMERWHLHRRLALGTVRLAGTSPRRIVAGFMLSAGLLSMWISNTATALMMLPIGLSIVELVPRQDAHRDTFATVLVLAIAYACSIGGMATLIGTPTNALLAAFLQEQYGQTLSFVSWMRFGVPLAAVGLLASYFVLTRMVFPVRLRELPGGGAYVNEELQRMGPLSRPERIVAIVFGLVAVCWITQPLLARAVPGLTDTGIAIAGALLLFVLPAGAGDGRRVLDWEVAARVPWGVLLLFGGGLSLAAAIADSGLAEWLGGLLTGLSAWPVAGLVAATVTLIVLLTELTSNTATAAAFLPVLASLADAVGLEPLLLLAPAAVAASCAFMLPVATPPNAIVYGSGHVTIGQMVRAGLWLNALFVGLIVLLAFPLLGPAMP